jgi:hypothetical protein
MFTDMYSRQEGKKLFYERYRKFFRRFDHMPFYKAVVDRAISRMDSVEQIEARKMKWENLELDDLQVVSATILADTSLDIQDEKDSYN